MLEKLKKDFNKKNYSLVVFIEGDKIEVYITDMTEKKVYCGIIAYDIIQVVDFISRKLKSI